MEIAPRRSLSLNLETTNKYFGVSNPISEMWTGQSMKTLDTPPPGYRMSHSLSMDDARVRPALEKKNNTILRSMIGIVGSLGSMVSKIPSFMSSINNPLSVTVVSNEGIITSEYILKDLTTNGDHTPPEPLKLFDRNQEDSPYNSKSNIVDILADRVGGKGFLKVNNFTKSWIEGLQDTHVSINSYNESNDLNLAIQESLRMKCPNNCLEGTTADTVPELIKDELEKQSDNHQNRRIDNLQDIQASINSLNESNDLNLAIQESLRMKNQSNFIEGNPPDTLPELIQDKLEINPDISQSRRIDDLQGIQESINSLKESEDLNLAIQESLRLNNQSNCIEATSPGTAPELICDKLEINSDIQKNRMEELKMKERTPGVKADKRNCGIEERKIEGVSCSAVDEALDRMGCEIPSKRPHLQKTRRKPVTIARSRGKARGKYQLRKSGVSQSKHRKERTKQNLYSNIQDDLNAWEEVEDDSSEDLHCRLPIVDGECKDADAYHVPKYPMFIETFVLGESGRTQRERKDRRDSQKGKYRVRFHPDCEENVLSTSDHDFRQRLLSESSIDSEDSCFIVFGDESESDGGCNSEEYDFGDFGDSSDEEDEEEEEEEEGRSGKKVRFNLEPIVHTMIQWNYAYRAARIGPWEQMVRDRDRFRARINCIGRVLDPILTVEHRDCIWHDRFSVDESISK